MSPQTSRSHDITATWHTEPSDHAGLVINPAAVVRRADDCQPHRLANLPPEAWHDLRQRYASLAC
eukprot:3445272-Alexandrium_andersonii.AAC.1